MHWESFGYTVFQSWFISPLFHEQLLYLQGPSRKRQLPRRVSRILPVEWPFWMNPHWKAWFFLAKSLRFGQFDLFCFLFYTYCKARRLASVVFAGWLPVGTPLDVVILGRVSNFVLSRLAGAPNFFVSSRFWDWLESPCWLVKTKTGLFFTPFVGSSWGWFLNLTDISWKGKTNLQPVVLRNYIMVWPNIWHWCCCLITMITGAT